MCIRMIAYISLFIFVSLNIGQTCTIAVVSGKVTEDGRPLLFKTRDERDEYRQEVKYYKPQGDEKYGHMSVVKWGFSRGSNLYPDVINGAGINDEGLIISNTTVSGINPANEITNSNMYLLNYAISHCKNLLEFEELLDSWHTIKKFSTVHGNFALVDSEGGAAMYEVYAPIQGAKVRWEKFDANSATDRDGNFTGFVVRTNDNQWSPYSGGAAREKRANEILRGLVNRGNISYKSLMRDLARDVCGDVEKVDVKALEQEGVKINADLEAKDIHNFFTESCISRYNTNFAFIGRGIKNDEDKRLINMWVNLGEPSVGIFTPYFPLSKKVPLYAWADKLRNTEDRIEIIDENSTSLMNNLIVNVGELSAYENIQSILDPLGLIVLKGVDKYVDYSRVLEIQNWVFPTEDIIIEKTEKFLNDLRTNIVEISDELLYSFSEYSLNFAYDDYEKIDKAMPLQFREWNFKY